MITLACDPGCDFSAWVLFDGSRIKILEARKESNETLLEYLRYRKSINASSPDRLVCEMVKSYGMSVGDTVFQTCVMIGRILEASLQMDQRLVHRKEIVTHICGSARAKDGNVRQALIDRFGGEKELKKPVEEKRSKRTGLVLHEGIPGGVLCNLSGDMWSALAVAVYDHDTR